MSHPIFLGSLFVGLCGGVGISSSLDLSMFPSVLMAVMLTGACLFKFKSQLIAGAIDGSVRSSYIVAEKSIRDFGPDVIVGFSWGGALTCEAIRRGEWKGPTVLLAPAHHKLHDLRNMLPPNISLPVPTIIVHSKADTIVPIKCSRELSQCYQQGGVKMVEIENDPHAMWSIAKDGSLAEMVHEVGATLQK